MSDSENNKHVKAMADVAANPIINSIIASTMHDEPMEMPNGFRVVEMQDFNPELPASYADQYHTFSIIGRNASNTTHHHEFGDVTIFDRETSPVDHNGMEQERYLIIADQWSGKQIKVFLPKV